jgi:hypothetical protein
MGVESVLRSRSAKATKKIMDRGVAGRNMMAVEDVQTSVWLVRDVLLAHSQREELYGRRRYMGIEWSRVKSH